MTAIDGICKKATFCLRRSWNRGYKLDPSHPGQTADPCTTSGGSTLEQGSATSPQISV